MRDWVLRRADLTPFLERLSEKWKLMAPQRRGELFEFRELENPSELRLDYPTTMIPPSRLFLPEGEVLYRFRVEDPGSAEAAQPGKPMAVVGIHPCDLEGISIMDEIFLSAPADRAYANRRDGALLIGVECVAPCLDESLCADKMTTHTKRAYDLLLIPVSEEHFIVRGRTSLGNDLADRSDFFRPATHRDRSELDGFRGIQATKFRPKFGLSADELSAQVRHSWDDLLWRAQSRLCLSCGACNAVCPTCHCFVIRDHLPLAKGERGTRNRHYTGCQLKDFAVIAGGENFREEKSYRLRHRVFKKEVYGMDRFGRSGCVGCGRCGHFCPAGIRMVEIFSQISGKEVAHA